METTKGADSSASRHMCHDKTWFKTSFPVGEKTKVLLGVSHTTNIVGTGEVQFRFTSGHFLTLRNVLHNPKTRKNLVSSYLLNTSGFRQSIEFNHCILHKYETFVGKGYTCDVMLKLNAELSKLYFYLYCFLCEYVAARLFHTNSKYLKYMSHIG